MSFSKHDKVMLLEPPVYATSFDIKSGDTGTVLKSGCRSISGDYYSVIRLIGGSGKQVSMYDYQIVKI